MIKIVKIVSVDLPISETKLGINGPIGSDVSENEQAFQMVVESYNNVNDLLPFGSLIINHTNHLKIIDKYGLDELRLGVKIDSLFDIMVFPDNEISCKEKFEIEVEKISEVIINKLEHDSFYGDYGPGKFKDFLEETILSLRDKFRIENK